MARYLDTPNDSGRESSADPLDVISPPRSKPLSLPPPPPPPNASSSSSMGITKRPRGRPKSISIPTTFNNSSRGKSHSHSHNSSRSTSPIKSNTTERGRGRGNGRARGRPRGSKSNSPDKRYQHIPQESDSEFETESESESESGIEVSMPKSGSASSSRGRGRGKSHTTSRSTSPFKNVGRGRGNGRGRGKSRGSKSTSPDKRNMIIPSSELESQIEVVIPNRGPGRPRGTPRGSKSHSPVKRKQHVILESQSESEVKEDTLSEKDDQVKSDEEQDRVDPVGVRQKKKRRIESDEDESIQVEEESPKIHEEDTAEDIVMGMELVEDERSEQEGIVHVKDEVVDQVLEGPTLVSSAVVASVKEDEETIRTVEKEEEEQDTIHAPRSEIILSEDSDMDEQVPIAEEAEKDDMIPTVNPVHIDEAEALEKEGVQKETAEVDQQPQTEEQPKGEIAQEEDPNHQDANINNSEEQNSDVNISHDQSAVNPDTLALTNSEPSKEETSDILPSATVAPIHAADSASQPNESSLSESLAEQSAQVEKEPKDLVIEDIVEDAINDEMVDQPMLAGSVEQDNDVEVNEEGLDGDLGQHPTGEVAEEQDRTISSADEVQPISDTQPILEETPAGEGTEKKVELTEEQSIANPSVEKISAEAGQAVSIEQSVAIDSSAGIEETVVEPTEPEITKETPITDGNPSGSNNLHDDMAINGVEVHEGKMDIDEVPARTHTEISVEETAQQEKVDQNNEEENVEGEMELDNLPQDEPEVEQNHAEDQSSTNIQTPSATPAPSSPGQSVAASQTSSFKPIKKPGATGKKRGPVPGSKRNSTPASTGSGAGKKAKIKGKTKVEELKATSKSKLPSTPDTSSIPSTPTKPTSHSHSNSPNPSPDKNAIYCVCRKPYSEEEDEITMLGCESCDNWFHPECVGLNDDLVEAVDVYICKSCERSTHQSIIWKQLCKREECKKSVAGSSSKFCSPSCAYQHSQTLLASSLSKQTLKQLAKTFISYPEPKLGIQVVNHHQQPSNKNLNTSSSNKEISDRLLSLERQILEVEISIKIILKRQQILDMTIEKSENLPNITNIIEEEEEEVKHKKGKKKKVNTANGIKDDKPCGWDKRLILDDSQIDILNLEELKRELTMNGNGNGDEEMNGQNELHQNQVDGSICMRGRRRCDRHQGWQKTIAVQLEIELTSLERTQKSLQTYIEELKSSNEVKSATDEIRNDFLERKGLLNN